MADPPNKTFGFTTPREWLGKMGRELARLESTNVKVDIADHAMNFAWTAWHMAEWVWLTLAAHEDQAKAIKANVDATLAGDLDWRTKKPASRFREYVIRTACPELKLCGDIANEAKHFERRTESVSTVVSARTPAPFSGLVYMAQNFSHPDFPQPGVEPVRWIPKIVTPDGKAEAVEKFRVVRDFWARFIKEHAL